MIMKIDFWQEYLVKSKIISSSINKLLKKSRIHVKKLMITKNWTENYWIKLNLEWMIKKI